MPDDKKQYIQRHEIEERLRRYELKGNSQSRQLTEISGNLTQREAFNFMSREIAMSQDKDGNVALVMRVGTKLYYTSMVEVGQSGDSTGESSAMSASDIIALIDSQTQDFITPIPELHARRLSGYSITTGGLALIFDAPVRADSIYTVTNIGTTGEITITEDGDYLIDYGLSLQVNTGDRYVRLALQKYISGAWTYQPGCYGYIYAPTVGAVRRTGASFQSLLPGIVAGEKVRIYATAYVNNVLIQDQTLRLNIMKMESEPT